MFTKLNLISKVLSLSSVALRDELVRSLSTIPKAGGQAIGKKRFRLPVEKDLTKLKTHCCGANYFKSGDEVKLKDDSEYPEWLWELPLKPPLLHELDPNTKEYWEKAEIVGRQREWKLSGITNKKVMVLNEDMIKKIELKYRRRFRTLAKYYWNAGQEIETHHERQDFWNLHLKEKYRVPENPKPFYPGIDQVDLPRKVANKLLFRKNVFHIGRFGR